MGSHGGYLLLFMMKVMVGYFVIDTHKVMTTLLYVVFILDFVGADPKVTFNILFWIFLCNLMDIVLEMQQKLRKLC